MSFKHYLSQALFLVVGGIILSPLNTFAGTLTNTSYSASSYFTGATSTYTFSYTLETEVRGQTDNILWIWFNNIGFNVNSVGSGNITVTVNGVTKSVYVSSALLQQIIVMLNETAPAGANIVVTISNIVNPGSAGTYGFNRLATSVNDGGSTLIDTGSLSSIVITSPDTTAPTITNISSDKANGYYKAGEVIDIDVTFSEAVTSTGNVTVTLETGDTDRTCTFSVTSSTTGTCNYTVQAGDTSADLTVASVSGTIADGVGNVMTNFVPTTNLAANKAIVIDTTAPNTPGVNTPSMHEVIRSSTYTATGTCETGATVSIASSSLQSNPTTVTCSSGVFSVLMTFVGGALNTEFTPSFTQTDLAGNVSGATTRLIRYAQQETGGGGRVMGHEETQVQNDTQSTPPAEPTSSGNGIEKSVDATQKESPEPIEDAPAVISPAEVIVPKKEVYTFSADITRRRKNSIQDVTTLQKFLNKHEGNSLDLTGIYDIATEKAINRFQLKYASEILAPWDINYATGNVAIYTRKKINALIAESGI